MFKVEHAEEGRWIQIILFDRIRSGIYRVGRRAYPGRRYAYKEYTGERVKLAESNKCEYVHTIGWDKV